MGRKFESISEYDRLLRKVLHKMRGCVSESNLRLKVEVNCKVGVMHRKTSIEEGK